MLETGIFFPCREYIPLLSAERTARLVEFYLLMRAGVPDISSLVLSNFYNLTRSEYYRQIDKATNQNDITDFLFYAIQGFRDGRCAGAADLAILLQLLIRLFFVFVGVN